METEKRASACSNAEAAATARKPYLKPKIVSSPLFVRLACVTDGDCNALEPFCVNGTCTG